MDASAETIATRLLDWYDRNARVLPWRSPPGRRAPEPYRVWMSEIMLQQTTVAAVQPYFERFIRNWPTVQALASASDADVMAAWAGLGYYARARNLLACAREIAGRQGRFPETEAELLQLPGVGAYTAAAIAAIAFGQRAAVIDANVERVIARLDALEAPLPKIRAGIRSRVFELTPDDRPGDFAQAMMDLGATVCSPRRPRCQLCPLGPDCKGAAAGAERFPVKPAKSVKPQRSGQAYWIEREGRVWLVRRSGSGMLAGMRALPDDGWTARIDGGKLPPLAGAWHSAGVVRHVFTHFKLDLHLQVYSGGEWASLDDKSGEWWRIDQLSEAGLPTLFAKAAQLKTVQ